jgi:hypothetical protein
MKRFKFILIVFLLPCAGMPVLASTSKSIRFQVTNGTYTDETLLGFYTSALDEFDPYDSHKFSNDNPAYPELFFLASGEEVAINGLPSLLANKSVALGFRTGTAGNFTIRISDMNMDVGTKIILKDNLLSLEQELTLSSPYTFAAAIGTTYTRFTLFIYKALPKVVASDRAAADQFGSAVAVSGDYAVVGNNPADSSGSAYIYKRINETWTQVQKITASDIAVNDHFGRSVAICNEFIVIGAPGEDEDASGGNTLTRAGSAYIYRNIEGTWSQVQKIVAIERSAGANFGNAVSISGNYLVVGAQNDNETAGSAYIFRNNSGTWSQVQKITATDKHSGDHFGNAVSISGKALLVGAIDEAEDASGSNTLASSGSAYVFQNTAGVWSQGQKMVASDRTANDRFGCSVSLSGEFAVVGASDEDEDADGSNTAVSSGSAYVFKNNAGSWSQTQKIVATDRSANDNFGTSVAVSGNFILIGANNEDDDAMNANTLSSAGSAYLFKNNAGIWSQIQKLNAEDREANDSFGSSVGFSGKNGIIGNLNDSQDATGNNVVTSAGSVSFLRLDPPTRTWNGSSWGTTPTASESAVIDDTYNGTGFSCMDLVVNAGKKLTITSDLNIYGNLTLRSDAVNGRSAFVDNDQPVFVANSVNVEQYFTGVGGNITTGRFWYLSSPLTDASSSSFDLSSINPLNKLWTYSEPTTAYNRITTTELLKPGYGYVTRLGAKKTVLLTGTSLNTGDLTIPITRTGTTNDKRGFNLIGNPYPSFAELDTADNPALERTYWYRSFTTEGSIMVFDTYNLTSNTAVVASGSGELTKYIPPMQAFWVKSSVEGASNVVFRNAKRSQQTGASMRSASSETLRLQLSNGILSDETFVGFYADARTGFDPYDSHKLSNESAVFPEIFTLAGSEELAINGLPPTETDIELPLGFRTGIAGSFTFKVKEIQNLEATILLKDKLLNTTQNLSENPSYSFQSEIANTSERFSLILRNGTTDLRTNITGDFEVYGSAEHRIKVSLKNLEERNVRIRVFDTSGRLVFEGNSDHMFQPGIYIVKVTAQDFSAQKKVQIGR